MTKPARSRKDTDRTSEPAGRPRRTTLAIVARAAGVSLPTVSKVLNGHPDVAADTRAHVERILREHAYAPTAKRRRPPGRTVALVFHNLVSPYAAELIRGVTDGGSESGVDVVVSRVPDSEGQHGAAAGDSWARQLVKAGREGIIVVTPRLTSQHIAAFERARIPLVVIDPVNLPREDVTSVGATNWAGGVSATKHLIDLGHRRIAFVGGPQRASSSQARLHGYRAALENAALTVDANLVTHGTFHYDEAYNLGLQLLERPRPPTAIFAASDVTAFGVMEAARAAGLRVPDELSIVGFDDTFIAAWSTPPLTTVHAPLRDMGRVAIRTLMRLVAGETLDSYHVELATHLVVRGSTGPPPTPDRVRRSARRNSAHDT
jgi:LacI family transcriptional regulator